MKVLVFDTETTGLPERSAGNVCKTQYWPHVIQLSYIMYDTEKRSILVNHDHIIKLAPHVNITETSIEMHGITREKSERDGVCMKYALELFIICMKESDVIVAHNMSFDREMIGVECIRQNCLTPFNLVNNIEFCTMKSTVKLCRIERVSKITGRSYYKYPTLSELHHCMFNSIPQNTHNSLVDVLICLRCFVLLSCNEDIRDINRTFRTLYKHISP